MWDVSPQLKRVPWHWPAHRGHLWGLHFWRTAALLWLCHLPGLAGTSWAVPGKPRCPWGPSSQLLWRLLLWPEKDLTMGGKSPTRQQPLNAQDWGRGPIKGEISLESWLRKGHFSCSAAVTLPHFERHLCVPVRPTRMSSYLGRMLWAHSTCTLQGLLWPFLLSL